MRGFHCPILAPQETKKKRPTVIYFHGGGFFGGDKASGDPMATLKGTNVIFNQIRKRDYNLVSVNYALVPDCRFPIPLIQMNEALKFLSENRETYGLNMDNIIIFGQSAGAILTAQYGALLTNQEYQKKMALFPAITKEQISALIIDDAPLQTEKYNFALWILMCNYLGNSNVRSKKARLCNAFLHIKEGIPPTFMTAGNTDGFPKDMEALSDKLTALGVENEYYFKDRSYGDLPHGYLGMAETNPYAKECLAHILDFMDKYAKGEEL